MALDEAERSRVKENHKNEIVRHCRIGRVERKTKLPLMPFSPAFDFVPSNPLLNGDLQVGMFMPKCGCRVGSACGNVACPHRPVATCGEVPHLNDKWPVL